MAIRIPKRALQGERWKAFLICETADEVILDSAYRNPPKAIKPISHRFDLNESGQKKTIDMIRIPKSKLCECLKPFVISETETHVIISSDDYRKACKGKKPEGKDCGCGKKALRGVTT